MMKYVSTACALLVVMQLVFCNTRQKWYQNDFYNRYMEGDYRRLPLRQPYYLKAFMKDRWEINFPTGKIPSARVDKLYFARNSFVYGYGKEGERVVQGDTSDLISYYVVDLENDTVYYYLSKPAFDQKVQELQLSTDSFSTKKELDAIHETFRKTGKLPWYSEK